MLMARVLKRRRGGLPPIVTALIVIAAVATTGLVAWFMLATTSAAVKQPVLEVTDAYYVGDTLYVTVRNLGASNVTISGASVTCQGGASAELLGTTITIARGASAVLSISNTGSLQDGDFCVALVNITSPISTTIALQFRVITP